MDPLIKAKREGNLQRVLDAVTAKLREHLGQPTEVVLIVVEQDKKVLTNKTITILTSFTEEQEGELPVVLSRAVAMVKGQPLRADT
jgi:hypothetical protein